MAATNEADPTSISACQAQISLNRVWQSFASKTPPRSYPPIPRTSPERLAQASPDNDGSGSSPSTILYLAYGSNLAASTFQGARGIRPISAINVSAPAFDLTFDLPGIPYSEPCFANTAPRKHIPDLPNPPKRPPIELPPHPDQDPEKHIAFPSLPGRGPTWSRGLYGVVYEVTPEDYATIQRTEGGGSAYHDVQTLCLALPPAVHVPEQPPLPGLKPFLAHTLYAPRLPAAPPGGGGDGDGDKDKKRSKWREWFAREFLTPVRRPEADYAQPSLRYLGLLRTGAAEHYLPFEYQAYLGRLEAYTITQRRQEVGKWLFMVLFAPLLMLILGLGRVFADKEGKAPRWLAVAQGVFINLEWMAYDKFWKRHFGDGERTMDDDDDDGNSVNATWNGDLAQQNSWEDVRTSAAAEKSRLLRDW